MSFFDKIYDIAHTDLFKYVFHSGSNKVFVEKVSKIFNDRYINDNTIWFCVSARLRT